jgi:hypothetical protein
MLERANWALNIRMFEKEHMHYFAVTVAIKNSVEKKEKWIPKG